MENIRECNENTDAIKTGEIIKPLQKQQQQPDAEKLENLQQQQLEEPQQQQQQHLQEEAPKQNETLGEKSVEAPPVTLTEDFDLEEDDEDDDDEEKETSQKLIIDIPDEEEEEEDEKEEDEDDEVDVIPLEEMPPEGHLPAKEESNVSKAADVETIITLSDGEEDLPANEVLSKPGKVQKRRSAGGGSKAGEDEEQFRLKRRKINVAGAPKMPLTGYVRYMNDRRESLRKEHPTKTSMEHTKMIGEEWHSLPTDIKSSYLKAADADKQRYVKELHTFLKSRPDILASELAKDKARKNVENNSPNLTTTAVAAAGTTAPKQQVLKEKSQTNDNAKATKDTTLKDKSTKEVAPIPSTSQQALDSNKTVQDKNKRKRTPTPPTTYTNALNSNTVASTNIVTPGEIPIFTNEFLEHNKIYDMELRSLRKSKTDLEQQNSVLEKHVENMKFGVEKMITENNELEEKNRLLEIYLDKLKRKLALALASLPLPSAPNGATVDNIDKYMQDLHKMSTSNSHGPATLNKAKDIIRKLDLQIQL